MDYKLSNYNIPIVTDEAYGIYNTLTKAVVELSSNDFNAIQNGRLTSLKKDELIQLKNQGFIVDCHYDELNDIKEQFYKEKTSNDILHLSIHTTLNCNFGCVYCFEERRDVNLELHTVNKIINYISKEINSYNGIHIDFYGGEPLLNMEMIEIIARSVIDITNQNNKQSIFTITTNGYLLNSENVLRLKEIGIFSLQVTLDGPQEVHDSKRYLLGKGKTFNTIINNLESLKDEFELNIRVNVDRESINHVDKLMDVLIEKGLTNINLAIKGIVPADNNPYDKELLSQKEYANDIFNKLITWKKKGGKVKLGILRNESAKFCIVDKDSQMIITPEGKIYKCGESFIDDIDVGYIGYFTSGGDIVIDEERCRLWAKDPFGDIECINCNVLPICYGGCQMKRLTNKEGWCNAEMKYEIENYAKLYFELLRSGEIDEI